MKTKERSVVKYFKPYVAGKPISEVRRELGLKEVFKLASNENPELPSRQVLKAALTALGEVNRYPDGESFYLKRAIAEKYGISPACVLAGSGTDEIIEIIAKTFLDKRDEIVVSRHAFIRYKMAGELMGAKVRAVEMKGFRHDLKGMLAAVGGRTKAVFIANPNNPTGTYVNEREVREFMKKLPGGVLAVFDEAYGEYVLEKDYPATVDYIKKGYNAVMLRTFSKIYGLAGLRVGYCIANKSIIEPMNRIRPPFNVNSLAQAAAAASLADGSRAGKCAAFVKEQKKKIEKHLEARGLEYVPSAANFLLIRCKNGRKVYGKLLAAGIITRAMDEYELPEWIRVTIGRESENERFLKIFGRVMENEK